MIFDPAEFVSRLDGGELRPSDLSGLEFQKVAFDRICTLLARMVKSYRFTNTLKFENRPRGEIDFILCLLDPRNGEEVERHFFECKNYRRSLELADAAKFLLIGLRQLPASLNLVSATPLAPQAAAYAQFFYAGDPSDAIRNDKVGGRTVFRHWVTRDLMRLDAQPLKAEKSLQDISTANISWEIVSLNPYFETVIASSSKPVPTVDVEASGYYRIEAQATSNGSRNT
jgi:hypothetical protein